jgi:hypothetical protein
MWRYATALFVGTVMASKRTGRPRGRPKKTFSSDPDRHQVAFIDALKLLGITFEEAARLAVCVSSEAIEVTSDQATLSRAARRRLEQGWRLKVLQRPIPTQMIDSRVDGLRRKWNRLAKDRSVEARRWGVNMRRAWIALLVLGPDHERLIMEFVRDANEGRDAEKFMVTTYQYLAGVVLGRPI